MYGGWVVNEVGVEGSGLDWLGISSLKDLKPVSTESTCVSHDQDTRLSILNHGSTLFRRTPKKLQDRQHEGSIPPLPTSLHPVRPSYVYPPCLVLPSSLFPSSSDRRSPFFPNCKIFLKLDACETEPTSSPTTRFLLLSAFYAPASRGQMAPQHR